MHHVIHILPADQANINTRVFLLRISLYYRLVLGEIWICLGKIEAADLIWAV